MFLYKLSALEQLCVEEYLALHYQAPFLGEFESIC